MKAISITLETLSNGTLRATGRHRGTTIACRDGFDACELVGYVMKETALGHCLPSVGYDLTQIDINDAAKSALP